MDGEVVFYVIAERKCPMCYGSGWVQHPIWKLYWEQNPDGNLASASQDREWFREHGYWDIPDEEVMCCECMGDGVVRDEVDLREALENLGRVFPIWMLR